MCRGFIIRVLIINFLSLRARLIGFRTLGIDCIWGKCRKIIKYGKDMRSVSDMLAKVGSVKCKRVKPNINQRIVTWAKKWRWPARSYWQDTSGSCSSRTGGGSPGYVATYDAMSDIYNFVQ